MEINKAMHIQVSLDRGTSSLETRNKKRKKVNNKSSVRISVANKPYRISSCFFPPLLFSEDSQQPDTSALNKNV